MYEKYDRFDNWFDKLITRWKTPYLRSNCDNRKFKDENKGEF